MNTKAWERAMGMRSYAGSPAEKEDRASGIDANLRRLNYLCHETGDCDLAMSYDGSAYVLTDRHGETRFGGYYEARNWLWSRIESEK